MTRHRIAQFIIAIVVVSGAFVRAQSVRNSAGGASGSTTSGTTSEVDLLVGRSTVLDVGRPIARVSLTTAEVADAMVTSSEQLLIHGKRPGTISLIVWDRDGEISSYQVTVRRDIAAVADRLHELFPGEPFSVSSDDRNIVLAGRVSSPFVADKAVEVATGYVESKDRVINLLQPPQIATSTQVMLRVRFAEVSRTALQELGVSLFSDGRDSKFGSTTTQQFAAPFFDQQEPRLGKTLVFSDYLNLFLFDSASQLGAMVKALSSRGLFQSLAEPNLIAQNGKEASFLAGGEYPYPAIQGGAGGFAVTVVFKEFGVRLSFIPTVLDDDVVHLKVKPEVSSLDFTNAVSFQGFRVPSLTTRRTDTEIELKDGQTFAIAGLLNNTVTQSLQKMPGLGDIPILGLLFKSKALQKGQTELVVLITPQIVRRDSPGAASGLPALMTPFIPPATEMVPPPAPRMPGAQPEQKKPNEKSTEKKKPEEKKSDQKKPEEKVKQ